MLSDTLEWFPTSPKLFAICMCACVRAHMRVLCVCVSARACV